MITMPEMTKMISTPTHPAGKDEAEPLWRQLKYKIATINGDEAQWIQAPSVNQNQDLQDPSSRNRLRRPRRCEHSRTGRAQRLTPSAALGAHGLVDQKNSQTPIRALKIT
jgi:hypothetical protein